MARYKKHLKFSLAALVVVGLGISLYTHRPLPAIDDESVSPILVGPATLSIEEMFPHVMKAKSTFFSTLRDLNISGPVIQQIVDAAKPIQNLAKLQPGIRFQLIFKDEAETELSEIQFRFSAIELMNVKSVNGAWIAEKITEKVDLNVVTFSGIVTSSLWESAQKAKMDPNLISELADIFGWEVDFAREVRMNDRWRLTVEQKFVKGEAIGWGAILAAEYENAGESHKAALFRLNGEEHGYFTPEGASLRKMFLKSPIRYGRISSGFAKKRFHPILQINRAHLGVDYAAPIGTPIRAVGDGVVMMAHRNGGAGNMIKLRHNSTYQTAYKHLQGFAKGIRAGARVQQGQVIGYVGNTGLSTGPHLHFEFFQSGRFVDPLGKKFPSADPVPAAHMADFRALAEKLLISLPSWSSNELTATATH